MKSLVSNNLILVLCAVCVSWSCSTVPITGRKQAKLLPEDQLIQMSLAAYNDFLNENRVLDRGKDAAMVQRVGDRLANSVEEILRAEGYEDRLEELQWEFNLVQDDLVNAWAMPGGKVVIYTGILDITKTETGLAVVMGHELAHAIGRHGNERMSQYMVAEVGFSALDVALMNEPEQTRALWLTAAGVGAQLGVLLPFSRKHESEADELGLIFMAAAGYDPHEAARFWERMNAASGGAAPPEFLSTHPSHETRIADIENEYLPVALTYYDK